MSQDSTDESPARQAHEEDECLLCEPAPNPNCEMHTTLQMLDPMTVPLLDAHGDHLVSIPVCLDHYQAFKQYQRADGVVEVDVT